MARVSVVAACSHSPFLFVPPEDWNVIRERKLPVRQDVPWDSLTENKAKYKRCLKSLEILEAKIRAANPDVLLIVGNDQLEQFNFANYPTLSLYLGEDIGGSVASNYLRRIMGDEYAPAAWSRLVRAKGCPEVGRKLLIGLMKKGFDFAFSLELPKRERDFAHAFVCAAYYLTPDSTIPLLPILVNCDYSPPPSGKRCYELGKAIREVIEELPATLNVAVAASGGLWHTPGVPNAYIDEGFDTSILTHVSVGDARGMAEVFDRVEWPPDRDASPEVLKKLVDGIGIPVGVGRGVGETRSWIVAASVLDGIHGSVVDYVPIYASPTGAAFAYWLA